MIVLNPLQYTVPFVPASSTRSHIICHELAKCNPLGNVCAEFSMSCALPLRYTIERTAPSPDTPIAVQILAIRWG